jgi:hypothetical protein
MCLGAKTRALMAFLLGHMALDVHHCLQHVIFGERKGCEGAKLVQAALPRRALQTNEMHIK